MRNEIMGNIDEWRRCVEDGKFIHYFGYPNETTEWRVPDKWQGIWHQLLEKGTKGLPEGLRVPRLSEDERLLRME